MPADSARKSVGSETARLAARRARADGADEKDSDARDNSSTTVRRRAASQLASIYGRNAYLRLSWAYLHGKV
eukprot:2390990-Pleurochrysis_carterae.AAC.2